MLAIGPKAASQRFEVFTETEAVRLADGSPGGRAFSLVEVIDLSRPGEPERLRAELAALSGGFRARGNRETGHERTRTASSRRAPEPGSSR